MRRHLGAVRERVVLWAGLQGTSADGPLPLLVILKGKSSSLGRSRVLTLGPSGPQAQHPPLPSRRLPTWA